MPGTAHAFKEGAWKRFIGCQIGTSRPQRFQ